jgi:regulator of replication initiation timing
MADTMAQMEEKVNYAQTIINILQTRLNESIGQNIQLEAKLTRMVEDTKAAEPTPEKAK